MNEGLRFPTAGVVILAAAELGIKGTLARNLYYKIKNRQNEIEELEIQEAAEQNVKRLAKKIPAKDIEKMSKQYLCEHVWQYGLLFGTNKGDRGAAYRQCTKCSREEYVPDEHSVWHQCDRHPQSTVVFDKHPKQKPTVKNKGKGKKQKRSKTLMEIFEKEGFSTEEIQRNKDLIDKM